MRSSDVFDMRLAKAPGEYVLGISEHIPRYGLWITTDPQCQATIKGLVAEGYDFNLVYKWSCRPRETRLASQYLVDVAPGGLIHEAEKLFELHHPGSACPCDLGDYIREVFVAPDPELVRYVNGVASRVGVGVIPGDVIETVAGVKVFDSQRVRR